jgi:cytochrome P450
MTELSVVYRPLDLDTIHDPYPVYAAMRATGSPCWSDILGSWVVTSYDDCRRVLEDHETFAADRRRGGDKVPDIALNVHSLDPPEHTAISRELAGTLRKVSSADLAARVRVEIGRRLDALPAGPTNLITAFTEPLACWFLSEALGLPALDTLEIRLLGEAIHYAMDSALMPERREPGRVAHRRLAALIETWLAEMPAGRPLSSMVRRANKNGVARQVVVNSIRTLVVNAFTSLPSSVGNVICALGREENLLDQTVDLGRAVQEFLRHESPSQGTTRLCVADTELAGTPIRSGDSVYVLVAAANRDPAKFDEPDRLRLDRRPNPHMAFGHGVHACAAALLSRMLLRELLAVLTERRVVVRLAGPVVHKSAATVRMIAELPAALAPRTNGQG